MSRLHEDEYTLQEILVQDVVLDVVRVVLDAEGQEVQDETQQLDCARVHDLGTISCCVGKQWRWKYTIGYKQYCQNLEENFAFLPMKTCMQCL